METNEEDIEYLENNVESDLMWKGIGGYFDTLGEILCEFIDNSISNIRANQLLQSGITITIKENLDDTIRVAVEDPGTGIKNLSESFKLGSQKCKETPLNEHGFGFKHALASANPQNNDWEILTETEEDRKSGLYRKICSPYIIGRQKVIKIHESWPGQYSTGTIVMFSCSRTMFETIRKGISGSRTFDSIIKVLLEDLGFIYQGVLKSGDVTIKILAIDKLGNKEIHSISPVEPKSFSSTDLSDPWDLGNGEVQVEFRYGRLEESPNNYRYYKANMDSSGVEIRINGRLLAHNLFKEIWLNENHPKYNRFLATINLISDDPNKLPKTKTSKNGLREGDPRLAKLFEWISSTLPLRSIPVNDTPDEKKTELDLFKQLKEKKEKHFRDSHPTVLNEMPAYDSLKQDIRMDLYFSNNGEITIYEGKKDKTRLLDLYQLLMYWDGYVFDNPGVSPKKGILISASHPEAMQEAIKYINTLKDANGNKYNIETRTWADEDINYPKGVLSFD